jgi:hypothetical protein
VFESDLIPFGADAPWKNDDYNAFLATRAGKILERINAACGVGATL